MPYRGRNELVRISTAILFLMRGMSDWRKLKEAFLDRYLANERVSIIDNSLNFCCNYPSLFPLYLAYWQVKTPQSEPFICWGADLTRCWSKWTLGSRLSPGGLYLNEVFDIS